MTFEEVLQKLEIITGFKPIRAGRGYITLCPAHNDVGPSLSVARAKQGDFALLYCFAGCTYKEIRSRIEDGTCVSPWSNAKAKQYAKPRKIVNVYPYCDQFGNILFRKIRFEPKSFMLQHRKGNRWVSGKNDITPVLYNLPKVINAKTVFILEGEKAVDKLAEWGLVGTCSFNGASAGNGKWLANLYNPFLQDKHIIILPDNDAPGKAHAQCVYESLGNVLSKQIVNLPGLDDGDDFYDWVEVGNTIDDLQKLCEKELR